MFFFRDYTRTPTGISTMKRYTNENMKHWIPLIIGVLALMGMVDSEYLTLAHYRVIDPLSLESVGVCKVSARSCSSLIMSPDASIAGIPHALLGAAYFAVILGAVAIRLLIGRWFAPWEMLGFLLAGLAFSAYLTQELVLRLHVPCPFCLTAHSINVIVLALYAISAES